MLGTLLGAGVPLINALNVARRSIGNQILVDAVSNSIDRVKEGKGAFGFNAATGEFEDLVKAGVIDPTKVVRAALQHAASVSSMMLTTEALIAEKPKKKEKAGGGAPGGEDFGGDY